MDSESAADFESETEASLREVEAASEAESLADSERAAEALAEVLKEDSLADMLALAESEIEVLALSALLLSDSMVLREVLSDALRLFALLPLMESASLCETALMLAEALSLASDSLRLPEMLSLSDADAAAMEPEAL